MSVSKLQPSAIIPGVWFLIVLRQQGGVATLIELCKRHRLGDIEFIDGALSDASSIIDQRRMPEAETGRTFRIKVTVLGLAEIERYIRTQAIVEIRPYRQPVFGVRVGSANWLKTLVVEANNRLARTHAGATLVSRGTSLTLEFKDKATLAMRLEGELGAIITPGGVAMSLTEDALLTCARDAATQLVA